MIVVTISIIGTFCMWTLFTIDERLKRVVALLEAYDDGDDS